MSSAPASVLSHAREALDVADTVLITAGAGMGVDSGLPDFRGDEGFWRAYPPFARLGLRFVELANPRWFRTDPALAWGFYGHRKNLYADTTPHAGFALLRDYLATRRLGGFVFTSNVDDHFAKAGFAPEQLAECHGNIAWLQCLDARCGAGIWPSDERLVVDPETIRAEPPWPRCPSCDGLARPNILMFGDAGWRSERSGHQHDRLAQYLGGLPASSRAVVIELGAGTAIPTVRLLSERVAARHSATHIRINRRESEGPAGTLSLPMGALDALTQLLPVGHARG